jgi:hypothetical protein
VIVVSPWRILRIAVTLAGVIFLILATVVVAWGHDLFGPPHVSIVSAKMDSNTTVNFTFGQPDKATPFSSCYFFLRVNTQGSSSRAIQTGTDHPMIFNYSSIHPNGTYTVVVHDLNGNGRIDGGDYLTVTSNSILATNERIGFEIWWARTHTVICWGGFENE